MKSQTTPAFRRRLAELPPDIQAQARDAYQQFQQRDPHYPGLRFHQVTRGRDVLYSVSVGLHYRALATLESGILVWFWIGHHSVYDKILSGR